MINQTKPLYSPDKVSPPGVTLFDILEDRSMSQTELAHRTGRPLKTINEIVKGKAAITSETALQLERVFGTPAEFWNQREVHYRAYLARQKELVCLAKEKNWLKQFPLKEMQKRGWIQDCGREGAEQVICLLNFFGVATPEQWEQGWTKRHLAFKKAMNTESSVGPTSVWLRKGEIEGEKIPCKPFDKDRLLASLAMIRGLTKERDPAVFVPNLKDMCAECGVAVVFVKPFPKVSAYGASYWLSPDKALIQLSLREQTADCLWFTVFHELGHILNHSKKALFIEELEGKGSHQSPEEKEADDFASEALIPTGRLNSWIQENSDKLSAPNLCEFAGELNVAVGILVGRLQERGDVKPSDFKDLKFNYEWNEASYL